ncbi:MAG: HAMP domain-containing protein [Zoogloeaceae bacterium]|jgi:two-component system osmolarity sensor histidine kinase EnvZ|nr:HAMP domain-containing protein [Zoogloeaceae bacterium]
MLLPRSLFARTFIWAAFLALLTNAAWMAIFRLADADPRARALAQFSVSVVNLARLALLTAAPELRTAFLQELSDDEGIRLLPRDAADRVAPLPNNRFIRAVEANIRQILNERAVFALEVNGEPGVWISFSMDASEPDDFWLILPVSRVERHMPWLWLDWGIVVAFSSLGMAWVMASRVSRQLLRMATAARQVGLGQTPQPLPEDGVEELQRLAQAFNRMSRDLKHHEEEKAEILAGISHDLRTPLSRIRLEAELSLKGAARTGMVTDIEQMDAIIAQFLDYARGEDEEMTPKGDPNALLEAVVRHFAAIQHPVTLQVDRRLPLLPMKPFALSRALNNLIGNAWKYGAPPIILSGVAREDWLELSVSDCGPGIPASEVERLKRPFTRLENARSEASGTGLGFAIVERIAMTHGGSFELEPGPDGTGLRATLRLPLFGAECPVKERTPHE